MPNDYITLKALSQELNETLSGARINKIYMPEKDEVTFGIHTNNENKTLVISASPQNPRIHFTAVKKENPTVAPGFCMYLRKHVAGGSISRVSMLGEDRIFSIELNVKNEMHDVEKVTLIAEMMGRYSNILVVDKNGKIGSALKQIPFDTATKRCIIPGIVYTAPPQNKLLLSDKDGVKDYLSRYRNGGLIKYITSGLAGFSTETAAQAIYEADISDDCQSLSDDNINSLMSAIDRLLDVRNDRKYSPCCSVSDKKLCDYYVYEYNNGKEYKSYPSLNLAIDDYTSSRDIVQRHEERTAAISKKYRNFYSKTQKKLAKCHEKLKECDSAEYFKLCGDLILTNMHNIKRGDTYLSATDYTQPDCPTVKIELDNMLTPQLNAKNYYKKYAKLKRTYTAITSQIEQLGNLLQYLESIGASIRLCSSSAEIAEIESELEKVGAFRNRKNKTVKKVKPTRPVSYNIGQFTLLIGKNNAQNDTLTFKSASGGDIWLHCKDIHGSHGILLCGKESPDEDTLVKACEIVAYYTKPDSTEKIAVDYTRKKYVKRHPCGQLGMAIYTDYKTLIVHPIKHESDIC
ncbi:MAG: NFACT family protein [Clostridia bacterium]|nr:NFACT family protein [Clostridia bacterium]